MFDTLIAAAKNRLSADMALGGYVGWEGVGFNDWPFHQFRIGVSCTFPSSF